MYNSDFYGSDYYASIYYGVLRGDEADLTAFSRLSTRDVQYEALKLVQASSDTRTMEREYWLTLLGGNARHTTSDIMYEGIIIGLGFSALKDYYDNITGQTWPDHNTSEKAYWLKIIADNV